MASEQSLGTSPIFSQTLTGDIKEPDDVDEKPDIRSDTSQMEAKGHWGVLSISTALIVCTLGVLSGVVVGMLIPTTVPGIDTTEPPHNPESEETPGVSVPPGEETLSPSTTGTTTKSSLASQSTKKPAMNSHACDTEDCLYMSEMLIAMLNFNVDPCEDFYQYVCGSGGAPEGNAFTAISKKIRPSIVSTIYMTYPAADTQPAWQKATTLFMACAALKKTEKSEVTAVKNWLAGLDLDMATIHIGYPFDSIDMLVRCSFQLGIPAVFAFTVHKLTFTNGKRNVLFKYNPSDQKWLKPDNNFLVDKDALYDFYFTLFTTDPALKNRLIQKAMFLDDEALDLFETNKRKPYSVVYRQFHQLYYYTASHAKKDEWAAMILKYTGGVYNGSDLLIMKDTTGELLTSMLLAHRVGSGGLRFLIAWSLYRQALQQALPAKTAEDSGKSLDTVCFEHVKRVMESEISSEYLRKVVTVKTLQETEEMFQRIANSFRASLQAASWLTEEAKKETVDKINSMWVQIQHPENVHASSEMVQPQGPDGHSNGTFFELWLTASVESQRRLIADQKNLIFDGAEVKIRYYRTTNALLIPAAVLQPELYFADGPPSARYGSIGQIMGHEIMHAYDVGELRSDDINPKSWVTKEVKDHYLETISCLHASHNAANATPNKTADLERLGDFVGVLEAYAAFTSLPADGAHVVSLPGLNLTAPQLFFVSHCAKWCQNASPQGSINADERDRCTVPLMNMRQFSDAFRCKVGARMNPEPKCSFW